MLFFQPSLQFTKEISALYKDLTNSSSCVTISCEAHRIAYKLIIWLSVSTNYRKQLTMLCHSQLFFWRLFYEL